MSRDLGRVERLAKRIAVAQREAQQPLLPGLVWRWHVFFSGAMPEDGADRFRDADTQAVALAIAGAMLERAEVGELVCIRRVIDGEASA